MEVEFLSVVLPTAVFITSATSQIPLMRLLDCVSNVGLEAAGGSLVKVQMKCRPVIQGGRGWGIVTDYIARLVFKKIWNATPRPCLKSREYRSAARLRL